MTRDRKAGDPVVLGEKFASCHKLQSDLGDPLQHLLRNSADHGIEDPEVRRAAGKPEDNFGLILSSKSSYVSFTEPKDDGAGHFTFELKTAKVIDKHVSVDRSTQ